MPAVTADPLTLTRVGLDLATKPELRDRPVKRITVAPSGHEGEGFPVRRTFYGATRAEVDPFIMMDQMGEVDYAPYEPRGTDWHPHRGFETVTYIIDGTFIHQDSHGGGGVITNGGTQWMTAGGGILHIETPPEDLVVRGGLFHGIQLWVNLPSKKKMIPPAYQNIEAELVKLVTTPDAGAIIRIIAGEIDGEKGPGSTHTPIVVAHATLSPGARMTIPWNPTYNALAYGLAGEGTVGTEQAPFGLGRLAVFGAGDTITISAAADKSLDVLLLGGEPIGEPVEQYGPFVMNTRAELQQAFEDFQAGRLGVVPANGIRPFRGR
jgi:redox-sensitive bicupin YhaK (pirin superfamily)